jgi:hypothetical protein
MLGIEIAIREVGAMLINAGWSRRLPQPAGPASGDPAVER